MTLQRDPTTTDYPWDVDEAPTGRRRSRVSLVSADSITMQRPEWVAEGRIPVAGVTLIAGREGLGKTALAGYIAARLTRGQIAGSFHGSPADVVYVGDEDDRASVLVPRLVAAGADLSRVHFVDLPLGIPFALDTDVEALNELLGDLHAGLVIVDPLDSHLGGSVDAHRKAEVQRSIARLALLAQHHRCGVVGLAHLNKGEGRDVLARVVGSVGFTTAVRSVIGVGEHPDDESDRVAVLAKSNLTDRSAVPALRFRVEGAEVPLMDGTTMTTAGVVILGEEHGIDPHSIVSGLDSTERTERDEAADWLEQLLIPGPLAAREVERLAREENIARATLHRARTRVGVVIERDSSARGRPSTWSLPGAPVSSPAVSSLLLPLPGETKSKPHELNGSEPTERVTSHAPGTGDETKCDRCGQHHARLIPHHSGRASYCSKCCIYVADAELAEQIEEEVRNG